MTNRTHEQIMKPIEHIGTSYSISTDPATGARWLRIDGDHAGFSGETRDGAFLAPLSAENAAALRMRLPWLNPQPLGLAPSFGFGDRLGAATPGHILASAGTGVAPIFAQQSVRENTRTGRTPQTVLDDAMWAVFAMDWRRP